MTSQPVVNASHFLEFFPTCSIASLQNAIIDVIQSQIQFKNDKVSINISGMIILSKEIKCSAFKDSSQSFPNSNHESFILQLSSVIQQDDILSSSERAHNSLIKHSFHQQKHIKRNMRKKLRKADALISFSDDKYGDSYLPKDGLTSETIDTKMFGKRSYKEDLVGNLLFESGDNFENNSSYFNQIEVSSAQHNVHDFSPSRDENINDSDFKSKVLKVEPEDLVNVSNVHGDLTSSIESYLVHEQNRNALKMTESSHNNVVKKTNTTKKKSLACKICGNSYPSQSYLIYHMRIHTGEKPYSCKICSKSFVQGSHLKNHMRSHTGEKPFHCNQCGKSFTRSDSLSVHLQIHTGEKPFTCTICGRAFLCQKYLTKHNRIHTGEKPFTCKICGKCFSQSSNLNKHRTTHTKLKPYSCKICSKTFASSSHLATHRRIHNGDKPHKCICGKAFNLRSDLTRHYRIHTGEKPCVCKICGKSFSRTDNLATHARVHMVKMMFACQICDQSFSQSSQLLNHVKGHAAGNSKDQNLINNNSGNIHMKKMKKSAESKCEKNEQSCQMLSPTAVNESAVVKEREEQEEMPSSLLSKQQTLTSLNSTTTLAKTLDRSVRLMTSPERTFLQNHGILISNDTKKI